LFFFVCYGEVLGMKQKSDDADQTESRVGNCTDCGGLVSKQANTCPHCGNPKPFEVEPAPAAIESPTPTATHHERTSSPKKTKPTTPREKCPKCQSGTVITTPRGGKFCLSCSYSSEQKISTSPKKRVSQNFQSPNQPKPGKQNSNKLAWFVSVSVIVALILLVLWTLKKQGEEEAAYQRIKSSADATKRISEKNDLLSELINSHERLVLYHKDQRSRPIEIKQAVDNLKEKITECVEEGVLASQEADQYRNLMAAEQFTEAYRLLAIALVKIAGEMGVFDEGN
jgi:biotin carboxyl carrier protein